MAHPPSPRVRVPVMLQHWRWLTFLHWRYPAEVVQAVVPEPLVVETFDGSAWVGLVPFLMDRVRAPGVPGVPWLSRFPETNVRTYVRAPDGRTGIWFLSLDATRLPAVATGRASYGLPYFWSAMSVRRSGDEVTYRGRRRWPGPTGVGCELRAELGEPIDDAQRGHLDHFLTGWHRLFSTVLGRLTTAEAEHPPWRLRRVAVGGLRQDLIQAAGLPAPQGEPVLHASDGAAVRIGRWAAAR